MLKSTIVGVAVLAAGAALAQDKPVKGGTYPDWKGQPRRPMRACERFVCADCRQPK